ncbi:MAG TPA: hypothetical protein VL400_26360 [Polyangiaceae bacterium]|jgi:hypothetical protein|nr:hypothetical protein [Polyangiaceae bacterium]
MSRTVILSADTVGAMIEAHASMAAWYYALWRALSEGKQPVPPDDATRRAFVARLAADFPELRAAANAITDPRLYVPPPPMVEPPAMVAPPPPEDPGAAGDST